MDVGALLLFAIPVAITVVLAFVFLARRNDIARALCVIFQLFALALLYSTQQYLLSTHQEAFLALLAGWTSFFVIVVLLVEVIAWIISKL
jgi:hypothetical protein